MRLFTFEDSCLLFVFLELDQKGGSNQIKSNQFIHYIHIYTNISNLGIIISSKVAQRETKRLLRFGLLS